MKKSLQNIIVIFVLGGIIVALVIITNKRSEKEDLIGDVTKPFITNITNKKVISGNLYPVKEITVNSPISGILEEYYVEIDDEVKKGDKIAKIKLIPDPAQLEMARKNLNAASIDYENEKLSFDRNKDLFDNGVISKIEFELALKNYQISKNQYESANNQLQLLEEGTIASSNISNIVTAVTDGVITDLPLEEGAPVVERNNFREGSAIAIIARQDSFIFKAKVIESDVIVLKKGMHIFISPISSEGSNIEGVINKISPRGQIDNGLMKYSIEAVLKVPDTVIVYSGFNATAEIIVERKDSVLAVEEKDVIFESDSAFIKIINSEGKIEKKYVKLGISDGIIVEIINGIQ